MTENQKKTVFKIIALAEDALGDYHDSRQLDEIIRIAKELIASDYSVE